MELFLTHHGYDFEIIVVNQSDDNPFNRGALLNIGASFSEGDYFITHDVDMLPLLDVYQYPEGDTPLHLCWQLERNNFIPFDQIKDKWSWNDYCYGGVNAFTQKQFLEVGQFPYNFWGWGGEDSHMRNNLFALGKKIIRRKGYFMELPHKDNTVDRNKYIKSTNNTLEWKIIKTQHIEPVLNTSAIIKIVSVQLTLDKDLK